jgi:hypothetical protein
LPTKVNHLTWSIVGRQSKMPQVASSLCVMVQQWRCQCNPRDTI